MDAFDSDVLIFAADAGNPLGGRLRRLFRGSDQTSRAGIGSVFLLPELLSKTVREGRAAEIAALSGLLARLHLRPFDRPTAELSIALAAAYALQAADAAHLATAVAAGADRFITNNRRDFSTGIAEITVTYPEDLPAA